MIAQRRPTRSRVAMTLLEVILAMTVLASISTLVAALWSQVHDWTVENASHHRALEVERAVTLLDQQWRARTTSVSLGESGAPAVTLQPDALMFVTTAPVFFHESPMVRVVYRIERTGGYVAGEQPVWTLHYEESPVNDPSTAIGNNGAAGSDRSRRLVMIESAESLQWERWFDPPLERRGREQAGWTPVDDMLGVSAATPVQTENDVPEALPVEDAPEDDEIETLRAGRLVGVVQGDPLLWLFIGEPSR